MRYFATITVGRILEELKSSFHDDVKRRLTTETNIEEVKRLQEILDKDISPVTRATFYRLEEKLGLFPTGTTKGQWRRYSREEANDIKNKINEIHKLYS